MHTVIDLLFPVATFLVGVWLGDTLRHIDNETPGDNH